MKFKFETIFLGKENYPPLLEEISNPPRSINVLGKIPDENKKKIAVVGTRKATGEGRALSREISRKLAEIGIAVVSGLAMGIDTAAHEGALLGKGETLAVLGCGIDIIYPAQNRNLAERIIESGGSIISEYGPGIPVLPYRFLERNRIVAGLSLATIVIEAPKNSGALVTARLAAEAGREVFVFPGPRNHPNYAGSHGLIRDGARLVSSFDDIMEDLGIEKPELKNESAERKLEKITDGKQRLIAEAVLKAGKPVNVDKISELTKLEPQTVNQNIAFLILNGIIKEAERGYTI
jgi:DNA processing protein